MTVRGEGRTVLERAGSGHRGPIYYITARRPSSPAPLTPRQVARVERIPGRSPIRPPGREPTAEWGAEHWGLSTGISPHHALLPGAACRPNTSPADASAPCAPRPSEARTAAPGAREGAAAQARGAVGASRRHVRAPPPGLQRSTRGEDAARPGLGEGGEGCARAGRAPGRSLPRPPLRRPDPPARGPGSRLFYPRPAPRLCCAEGAVALARRTSRGAGGGV